MPNFLRQVGLLLWKNFVVQKRKICVSIFEIILPVFFAVILLSIRILVSSEEIKTPTTYKPATLKLEKSDDSFQFLYSPNHTIINNLMTNFISSVNEATSIPPGIPGITPPPGFTMPDSMSENFTAIGFSTEEDLLNYYGIYSKNVTMAFVFLGISSITTVLPNKMKYSLRPKASGQNDWRTSDNVPFVQTGSPRTNQNPDYLRSSFVFYQTTIDEAIIRTWNSSADLSHLEYVAQKMPYPPHFNDPMIMVLQNNLPILLLLSFILNVVISSKGLIQEKEYKLKESMKLMGLSSAAHWTAWYLTVLIYLTVAMSIYTLLLGLPISLNGAVLGHSNPFIVFIFLMSYGLSIISFSFLISVFFNKANIGAAAAGILFFASYVPYFFVNTNYQTMTRSEKLTACLLSNTGMGLGAYTIGLYEGTGEGVQWSTIAEPASVDDNFSMLDAILLLLGDAVIYLIIVWYVDNVYPGEFGVAKPFYFPFTKYYWCGRTTGDCTSNSAVYNDPTHFEKEPSGVKAGISISNLKKEFNMGGKKKFAVNDMNLNVYDGQITVLLGHNGAGKTTTMSMLTGFISPTSGTAIVNGCDISNDINGVRSSLGLCPQHNVLFDSMTVDEHLEFFALLKGTAKNSVKKEVETMAKEIGLETKRQTRSMHLSGGQKRKLCVGIALIGGSKIVILDEPTSGMDPAARRQTWDILQRNRSSRTILLTTHFMDEADLLGDRIAIMSDGKVKCVGSSHFLKKLYGAGYHLVMVKSEECNVSNVTEVVKQYIPSATLESQISAEISYLLPNEESGNFSRLFGEIETRKNELGINSFGTSATTMEEVFLKVGEGIDDEDGDAQPNGIENAGYSSQNMNNIGIDVDDCDILAFNKGYQKVTGIHLELSRFYGMFMKKAIHTWRNKLVTIVQLLVPVIATCAALGIAEVQPNIIQQPAINFKLEPFDGTFSTLGVTTPNTETNSLKSFYKSLFTTTRDTVDVLNGVTNYTTYFVGKAEDIGLRSYNNKMIIGADFSEANGKTVVTMFYNLQPYHALPISVTYMMNAVAQQFTSEDVEIETMNYPLPTDVEKSSSSSQTTASLFGFLIAFCILFGMAFLSSSFVVFLIKERQVGAKHLQKVSGVGTFVYWISNITWDFINYLLPCILIMLVFAAFGTDAYLHGSNLGYVFLTFVLYGVAILPYIYVLHFLFTTPASGMVAMIILNIMSGLVTLLAVFILGIPSLGTEDIAEALDWIFCILFPQFNLGKSLMNIYSNYNNYETCLNQGYPNICNLIKTNPCCSECSFCISFTDNYLQWDQPGIGRYLVLLLVQAGVTFFITLIIEAQVFQKIWYKIRPNPSGINVTPSQDFRANIRSSSSMSNVEDDDVTAEKHRVSNINLENPKDAFVLKDLYKRYGNFVAVDHISVGIPERECFGLLGQNGAGKTTTFKMLTGDVMVTSGNAYLENNDIKSTIQKVQENLGYCPQFDALIDQMTGRETLYMYGRLRGVPGSHLKGVVNSLIDILMLRKHADKTTQAYSGGNKRKLSTALALIGDPGFILLDEPSSGVDPRARRQLWNVLSKVRDSGKTLILTSHSMEECDALCTRVAIMVNGKFKCLGSPQHLKNKYGHGYSLICRMMTGKDGVTYSINPLVDFISRRFPSAAVFDDHQGYAHFQIPDNDIPLAGIFDVMEQSKKEYFVEDYSVHQTTLEQVFLTFTGRQIPPREDKSGCFKRVCCC